MLLPVSEKNFARDVLDNAKPVIVHFWAPWCGLCKLVNPLLIQLQQEWTEELLLMEVNADKNLRLATTYHLTNLPTLIWFEQGQVIERLEHFRSRDDLQQQLRHLASVRVSSPASISIARQ